MANGTFRRLSVLGLLISSCIWFAEPASGQAQWPRLDEEIRDADFAITGFIDDVEELHNDRTNELCGFLVSIDAPRLLFGEHEQLLNAAEGPASISIASMENARVGSAVFVLGKRESNNAREAQHSGNIVADLCERSDFEYYSTYIANIKPFLVTLKEDRFDIQAVEIPASRMSFEMTEGVVGWRDFYHVTSICIESVSCSERSLDRDTRRFFGELYYIDIGWIVEAYSAE